MTKKQNNYEIDWEKKWIEEFDKSPKTKGKKWDGAASKFRDWVSKDDYPNKLVKAIKTHPNMTILDLGCGEGSVTLKLAEKFKRVTALDSSIEMLKLLREEAEERRIYNIDYIHADLTDINVKDVGKHDIILASRSVNGIREIKERLKVFDEIAEKGVYLTLFGPQKNEFKEEIYGLLNREYIKHPSHSFVYNMLEELKIYANVLNLNCSSLHEYDDTDEAIERLEWKMGEFSEEEKEKVIKYFNENLEETEDDTLVNPFEKPDWVMVWWDKNRCDCDSEKHHKHNHPKKHHKGSCGDKNDNDRNNRYDKHSKGNCKDDTCSIDDKKHNSKHHNQHKHNQKPDRCDDKDEYYSSEIRTIGSKKVKKNSCSVC
ncbi:MAG: class I SAM-dependent methyltransferase [Methanobacteriaceae archaeon]